MTIHEDFSVEIRDLLREDPSHWDRLIASDLAAEVKQALGEGPSGIPEMRRFLAVKGFRALKTHLQEAVAQKTGEAAFMLQSAPCAASLNNAPAYLLRRFGTR